jgi:uncharacterized protein (DUF1697 family)
MPVFVSLLRGINVGKHKRMKMDQLRSSLEAMGYREVKTYIQSGNVILRVERRTAREVSREIEERIRRDFGFDVDVITRSREEISKLLAHDFFRAKKAVEGSKLHVVFLPAAARGVAAQELECLTAAPDESRSIGKEIFLYLPNGLAQSSLVRNPVARRQLEQGTMRNWQTVQALCRLAEELR